MATEEITISELELADEILGDMNIPVDTATETRAVTLKQLRAWLGSSLPTGFIIPAVGKISDERFTLLDGKTLSREGTYSAFCNKVVSEVQAGNWFACSEEEYAQDISDFGQCGKFVISNDYVRIPTITRFIGATVTLSEIGKAYKESLPNITGSYANGINVKMRGDSGVFYADSTSKSLIVAPTGTEYQTGSTGFDASRSSSTYQNGAKVQPDHTKYPYYMVISTEGQTAPVEIDINKVYEDLNLKANTNLSNVSNVASSFKEQSVGWGMPDYSAGVSVAINVLTKATVDSVYYAYSQGSLSGDSAINAEIYDENNNKIFSIGNRYFVANNNSSASIFIPVPKGYTIKLTAGNSLQHSVLYPLKGVN